MRGVPGDDLSTPDKEQQAYNAILNWLNNDAAELLSTSQDPITDRQAEFLVSFRLILYWGEIMIIMILFL